MARFAHTHDDKDRDRAADKEAKAQRRASRPHEQQERDRAADAAARTTARAASHPDESPDGILEHFHTCNASMIVMNSMRLKHLTSPAELAALNAWIHEVNDKLVNAPML